MVTGLTLIWICNNASKGVRKCKSRLGDFLQAGAVPDWNARILNLVKGNETVGE